MVNCRGPVDGMPPVLRLALAYAPEPSRGHLLAFFALDARLAGIVRSSREPMLAQLRLAWWREQLCLEQLPVDAKDPLLAALKDWPAPRETLAALADGWEAMTGPAPLPASAFGQLAASRAAAMAALGSTQAECEAALRMGRNWALADIAAHLSDPRERETALKLAQEQDWRRAKLSRRLRPLAVMHGLAARAIRRDSPDLTMTPVAALLAIRIGLFGR